MKKAKYIYIISDGTDKKIGVATDPEVRLKALQTGNKHRLFIEHAELKNDAHKIEKVLHLYFQKNNIGGEWFSDLSINDIRCQIMLCTEYD